MCGIITIYCNNAKQRQLNEIINSHEMLANRGPDCGSLIINKKEILGFRRLSVVDLSTNSNQPFFNADKSVKLLCNGEIYNHKILEKDYDIVTESNSDCECIMHLYNKVGFKKMISLLNGDFAIVLFTPEKVYFARDRIGVRPLFYGFTNDGNFALASYARALSGFCSEINQIKPGWGFFNKRTKKITFTEYTLAPTYNSFGSNITTSIRKTLVTAVKDRLMSDRPICCLLSGGLDSSIVTSIVCRLIGPKNVRTYSIGMRGSEDLKYAKKVSDYLGTNHTEVLFTAEEGLNCIPHVIRDIESYDITTIRASVAMWLLSKYISKNTKNTVLLSGEGADELFCGYLYFHYAPNSKAVFDESLRLLKQLYLYDVLRADRCVSSHGLELRVPFLDRHLIQLCLSLPGEMRMPKQGMEKFILREAFEGFLPDYILNRRKDGMSDGVSGGKKKWYEQIKDFVHTQVSDEEFEKTERFPSKEAYYYRKIYDNIFPTYQPVYTYWLPKWIKHGGDPSGRNVKIFNE